ncbi:MAG: hypothetical protein KAJ03_09830 [Gammaproteobacteria bacterium]|nr:hypothetical protein [Gammaproteobacteria bacterium]
MSEQNTSGTITFGIKLWIVYAIIGYFVYGNSINAALGVLLLSFAVGIINILSIIPIVGWIAALALNWFYVMPKILEFVSLDYTWLITLIFVISAILGFIITAMTTGVILLAIIKR